MDPPPSDKQVSATGVVVSGIRGGKVAEEWDLIDTLGSLQQLGAVPDARAGGRGRALDLAVLPVRSRSAERRRCSGRRSAVLYLRLIWPRQDQKDVRYTNGVSGERMLWTGKSS